VSASEFDLRLIERCLQQDRQAWQDLVDRSIRVVLQVVRHTAYRRGIAIPHSDSDDLVSEVFLELCRNDFAVLRRFQGLSTFNTYLTVIARRVIVRNLVRRPHLAFVSQLQPVEDRPAAAETLNHTALPSGPDQGEPAIDTAANDSLAEVTDLLAYLNQTEAQLIRLHHLEGCSYQEISRQMGMAENSVGPALTRAREKMRAQHQRQQQPPEPVTTQAAESPATTSTHRRAA